MRIFLLKMLLPFICFNLAGGISLAASLLAPPVEVIICGNTDSESVYKKEVSLLLAASQILKEADENPVLKELLSSDIQEQDHFSYRFSSDKGFSLQYYLSFYDRYIKVRQPQVYLLDCVFII